MFYTSNTSNTLLTLTKQYIVKHWLLKKENTIANPLCISVHEDVAKILVNILNYVSGATHTVWMFLAQFKKCKVLPKSCSDEVTLNHHHVNNKLQKKLKVCEIQNIILLQTGKARVPFSVNVLSSREARSLMSFKITSIFYQSADSSKSSTNVLCSSRKYPQSPQKGEVCILSVKSYTTSKQMHYLEIIN